MRTLFLVRHSKAVTRKADLPDFQRTLVKAGEKKSASMAKKLKKEGVMPDLMISSTANRALETAHLFAETLGYSIKNIEVRDALYNEMSPEALLYIVRQVDDKHKSIMLFGHNPAFTDFASCLVKGFEEDIPKTGIVSIQFKKEKWSEITRGSGTLEFFEYPKRLLKTVKRLEMELKDEIEINIQDVLGKMDGNSARKMRKAVRKSSHRIAKDFLKILKVERAKEEKKALLAEKTKTRTKKSKARTKPKAKPQPKPKPKPKPTPKPISKLKPKPGTRTKPAPKPKAKSVMASKPAAKKSKTGKAAAPSTARQTGIRKQAPKTRVSRAKKKALRAKSGT